MPQTEKSKPVPRPANSKIGGKVQPVFGTRTSFEMLVELLNVLQTCRCRGSWANQYVTPEAKRTIDRILTNEIPRIVNINRLTKKEVKELGFKPVEFNPLTTVWRIPIWLENCIETYAPGIQNPLEVISTSGFKKGERLRWEQLHTRHRGHTDRGAMAKDNPHLNVGVLVGMAEEEKMPELKVTYGF